MKKLSLFLTLICSIGFAQNKQTDSLKHELAITKTDTSSVLIMAELCFWYRTLNPDSALFFGEKGMKLSEKIYFPKGLIRNITYYGRVMTDLGNMPKALAMQFKALQIAKDNNLLAETGVPLNYLGGNYKLLKEYSKALMYYKQANKIHETYNSYARLRYFSNFEST
jgi:two-component system, NtrC family, sensor kinase